MVMKQFLCHVIISQSKFTINYNKDDKKERREKSEDSKFPPRFRSLWKICPAAIFR